MEALEFLKQEVKTYNHMSITGLNKLPFVLYDSVAAAMEAYAKYYHETEVKKLNIGDVSGRSEQFYCADWNRCGSVCEEQCSKCKKAEDMPEVAQ